MKALLGKHWKLILAVIVTSLLLGRPYVLPTRYRTGDLNEVNRLRG